MFVSAPHAASAAHSASSYAGCPGSTLNVIEKRKGPGVGVHGPIIARAQAGTRALRAELAARQVLLVLFREDLIPLLYRWLLNSGLCDMSLEVDEVPL